MAEPTRSDDRRPTSGRARWWFAFLIALGALLFVVWRWLMAPDPDASPQPVLAGPERTRQENPEVAFEPTDWPVGPVALIYAGLLILLVISCFVLIAAYPTTLPDVSRTLRIAPPGPRLQTDSQADLGRFRAEEAKRLDTYYWIDKQKGVVHIPIEQAMKKLANSGVPGFPQGQQ